VQLSKRFGWDEASREAAAKQPKLDADALFMQSKAMLDHLGFTKYHRNIKNGLMTDSTIMLWNESTLQECRIPPGPRRVSFHCLFCMCHCVRPGLSSTHPGSGRMCRLLILYHISQVAKQQERKLTASHPVEMPDDLLTTSSAHPIKGKKRGSNP
jgi:hypothetical protein